MGPTASATRSAHPDRAADAGGAEVRRVFVRAIWHQARIRLVRQVRRHLGRGPQDGSHLSQEHLETSHLSHLVDGSLLLDSVSPVRPGIVALVALAPIRGQKCEQVRRTCPMPRRTCSRTAGGPGCCAIRSPPTRFRRAQARARRPRLPPAAAHETPVHSRPAAPDTSAITRRLVAAHNTLDLCAPGANVPDAPGGTPCNAP